MHEFKDVLDFFLNMVRNIQKDVINPCSDSLEEIVLRSSNEDCFAYIDNRRDAKDKYNFDFWRDLKKRFKKMNEFINWVEDNGIKADLLYSKSEQFPDFLFKVRLIRGKICCGSVLELKDSKGGGVASFNSTLPTKYKSLEEIDIINGNNLVSRIAKLKDEENALNPDYFTFQRRNFYLVRTHKGNLTKFKLSVVDGSFFETVPKEHLIYKMFLNILQKHLEQKGIALCPTLLQEIEKIFSHITDQTIIAASQLIECASVRPRLRIMAEVHTEGNPHSHFYPQIGDGSVNLILQAPQEDVKSVVDYLKRNSSRIQYFTIQHKRNGTHLVFQLPPASSIKAG